MRRTLVLAVLLVAPAARADDFDVGASVGASLPVGSEAHGARTSDSTHALAALAADATYRFNPVLGAGATLGYGIGVPTLCGSASECMASLGSDVTLVLRARVYLPMFLGAEPFVDLGVGWEWLQTTLKDGDARSSRSYDGPILLSADTVVPFPLGRRVTLGPALGLVIGAYSSARFETPAFTRGEHAGGALHAWPTVAARVSVHF